MMINFRLCGSGSNELQVHKVRREKQSDQGIFRVESVSIEVYLGRLQETHEKKDFVPKHLYNLK